MVATVSPSVLAALARVPTSDAPVFTPGQVLEALVLGKLPDGMTALRIGEFVVSAQLPPGVVAGATLQLQVTTGGATPQLAIVGQPAAVVSPRPMPMPPPVEMPIVVLQTRTSVPTAVAPLPMAVVTPPSAASTGAPTISAAPIGAAGNTVAATSGPLPGQPNVESRQPVVVASAGIASGAVEAVRAPLQAHISGAARPSSPPLATPSPASTIAVSAAQAPVVPAPSTTLPIVPPPSAPAASVATIEPAATPAASGPALVAAIRQDAPVAAPSGVSPPPVPGSIATPASTVPATTASPVSPQNAAPPQPPSVIPSAPSTPAAAVTAQPTASAPAVTNATLMPAAVGPLLAEAETASPLLVAQGAARPAASMADLPKAAPPAVAAAAPNAIPAQPASPAAALAQMVPEALAKQNAMGPLLASLASAVAKSGALPEPVVRAAMQVLAQRVALPPDGPTADVLKAAIARSGIYLEAGLAKGAAPSGDMKAALSGLKGALGAWLGGNPAPVQAAQQAAPPLRGLPPRAEMLEPPPLPDMPREAGRLLHSQADAALSRLKLMQFASLPDADPLRGTGSDVRTELPFLIGSEMVMAQFQVFGDGGRRKTEQKRGWTMRFAMNFAGAGEVGAEIGLIGRSVSVALWAAEPEMAERLNAALPDLAPALASLGLEAGAIRVRNLPPAAEKPASGHFLDSVS